MHAYFSLTMTLDAPVLALEYPPIVESRRRDQFKSHDDFHDEMKVVYVIRKHSKEEMTKGEDLIRGKKSCVCCLGYSCLECVSRVSVE